MNRYEWYEGRIKCVKNCVSLRHVTERMNFLVKLNYISVVKHNLIQNEKESYKLYYLRIRTQPNEYRTWKLSKNFHQTALWMVVKWDTLHVIGFKVHCV
jgi:hypothetical protein